MRRYAPILPGPTPGPWKRRMQRWIKRNEAWFLVFPPMFMLYIGLASLALYFAWTAAREDEEADHD